MKQAFLKRIWSGGLVLLALRALAPEATAELLAYEGFDYNPGEARLSEVEGGPIGGFGWQGGWTNYVQGTYLSSRMGGAVGASLDPGFPFAGTGRHLRAEYGGADPRWAQNYRRLAHPINLGEDGVYFISVLLRGSSVVSSDALVHIQDSTATTFDTGMVRFGLGSQASFGGNHRFTLRTGNGNAVVSDEPWEAGKVYLAVLKIDASSDSTNTFSVSFFHAGSPFPPTEPEEWMLTTEFDSGSQAAWLRLNGRVNSTNAFWSHFDELRVGTTWESVTPDGFLHVSPTGSDANHGRADSPLRTISRAAELAQPGDTVLVREGVYRERVAPARGGTPGNPIRYVAEPGKNVFIKGSDIWETDWVPVSDNIFQAAPAPAMFTDDVYWDGPDPFRIPFTATPYDRDGYAEWYYGTDPSADPDLRFTLGQVFVNGTPYEQRPFVSELPGNPGTWAYDRSTHRIHVHFHSGTPENERVEITTRRTVFAPQRTGLGHIHLDGFIIEHAANQYPRDFWMRQEAAALGMIDTRFGHNWVIENNIIRHASGMGIQAGVLSLDPQTNSIPEGAGRQSANNHPGGIVIRNNHIVDNGGGGVIASAARDLTLEGNVILRNNAFNFIGEKRWESAGFKAHQFLDSRIEDNYFGHNKAAGIWLDNRWVGVTIADNVFVGNEYTVEASRSLPARRRGVFLEKALNDWDAVVVEENIFLGNRFYGHNASGATFRHNLVANDSPSFSAVELTHLNDPDSRTDNHTIRQNLFIHPGKLMELPYPSHKGGPVRSSGNVYEAEQGARAFAPTRNFRVPPRPSLNVFCSDFLHPDLGENSPGVSTLQANDGFLTFAEWKAFWAHHDVEVDEGSILSVGNTADYDETSRTLTLDLAFDPAAMAVVPGPFPNLQQGENLFTIWDGLPLLAPGDLPRSGDLDVHHRPVAHSRTVSVLRGREATVRVRGHSENGLPLAYELVEAPSHGTLTGEFPELVYRGDHGFIGTDSFAFLVDDGEWPSDVATVTIQVLPREPVHVDRFEAGDVEGRERWLFSTWAGLTDEISFSGAESIAITRFGRAMREYNLLGVNRPVLRFVWKLDDSPEFEGAFVKVFDGDWHTVLTIDPTAGREVWHHEELDLSGFEMTADFKVLFEGFSFGLDHAWFVDEIVIEETPFLAYEEFNYNPGGSRLYSVNGGPWGGFGWAGRWTNFVQGNFLSNRIGMGTLNPGFPYESTGNHLRSDWGGQDEIWLQTYRQLVHPVEFGYDGVYYLSVLLRGSSVADSDALIHLQDTTSLEPEAGVVRFGLGSQATFGSNRFVLATGDGEVVLSEETWEAGKVYLAVLRIVASADTTDVASVRFFHADRPVPINEPFDWPMAVVFESDVTADWIRINPRGESGNPYRADFDELRLGRTWGAAVARPPVELLTYAAWRDGQGFAAMDQGDPSADPSGDGVANLMAYALGLDPFESNRALLPLPEVGQAGENRYLTLTVLRNPAAVEAEWAIEVSSDLVEWESGPAHTTILIDNSEVLRARDNTPLESVEKRFMRLRVDLAEPEE